MSMMMMRGQHTTTKVTLSKNLYYKQNYFIRKIINDEIAEDDDDTGEKQQCSDCQRFFKPESYAKHVKICKKVFMRKRKKFDTKQQRILDKEHADVLKHNEFMEKKGKNVVDSKKKVKKDWRAQSEMFREAMKQATGDVKVNNNVIIMDSGSNNFSKNIKNSNKVNNIDNIVIGGGKNSYPSANMNNNNNTMKGKSKLNIY